MTPSDRVGTLAIVGVGLIGGSFALGLKKAGLVDRVLGVGRRQETLLKAQTLGIIDEIVTIEQAARESDLIMVAAPVCAFESLFQAMAPHLNAHVILTDGGSTKGNVVQAARAALGARIGQFVPSHPMAGSHLSGPEAAFADLYQQRNVVLCPLPENAAQSVAWVRACWQACGANIYQLGVEQHDQVVASISHLPHWLANLYILQVMRDSNAEVDFQLAGPGFADFTRIAQGSEEMWRDIFVSNRQAMLEQIDNMHAILEQARMALVNNDIAWIESMLRETAQRRRAWERDRA